MIVEKLEGNYQLGLDHFPTGSVEHSGEPTQPQGLFSRQIVNGSLDFFFRERCIKLMVHKLW
jgi:hypothetical protein